MKGVDLGAGNGRWANVLSARGAQMIAVDKIDIPERLRDDIEWIQSQAEDWIDSLDPDTQFDFIVCFNMIHFLDRTYVLKELIPKLATHVHPGGWLAIRTFYKDPEPLLLEPIGFPSLYTPEDILRSVPGWRVHRAYTDKDRSKGNQGVMRRWFITDVLVVRPE